MAKIRLCLLGWVATVNNCSPHFDPNTHQRQRSPAMTTALSTLTNTYSSIEYPLTPKVDISAGPKSHLFQPPLSASSSLQSSTTSALGPVRSRKRTRNETHYNSSSTVFEPQTPPPLTDVRYRLKADYDSKQYAMAASGARYARKVDSRRQLSSQMNLGGRCWAELDDERPEAGTRLAGDGALPDLPHSPSIQGGLGNVIYRFAGVAGKVWRDWTTTFKGFCAGGGQGYEFRDASTAAECDRWQLVRYDGHRRGLAEVPGGFPQDDYIEDYLSQDHTQETPIRASKRSRSDDGSVEKWVVVEERTSQGRSPQRLSQRKLPASSGSPRRTERTSSSRRPAQSMLRPSIAGSPRLKAGRASLAPVRSPVVKSEAPIQSSPVSAEVQRHAARLRRKEAEEDAHLKRFNAQLKAMIREGKEALGTTFEIEDDVSGENVMFGDMVEI